MNIDRLIKKGYQVQTYLEHTTIITAPQHNEKILSTTFIFYGGLALFLQLFAIPLKDLAKFVWGGGSTLCSGLPAI